MEEVDASVAQSAKDKEEVTEKDNNKVWYSDLLSNRWLIALPIVIIVLIFYIENRKSRKAKAAARKQRFK